MNRGAGAGLDSKLNFRWFGVGVAEYLGFGVQRLIGCLSNAFVDVGAVEADGVGRIGKLLYEDGVSTLEAGPDGSLVLGGEHRGGK